MYKIFRNILTVIAVILCTITCASANSEYSVLNGMITKYNGDADVVTVPAVIDDVEIAGIETGAFYGKDMHTVIIEEGIEVIQPKAFEACENLRYIKTPESMLLINEDAFFECNPWLELDVCEQTYIMGTESPVMLLETEDETGGATTGEGENGEEVINFLYSEGTITGYIGVDTDIIIPDSIDGVTITAIAANAFTDNTELTTVVIPDTVTSIGAQAFKGCKGITEVTLPESLSSAGKEAFMNCSALTTVTVPGTLKRIPDNMFYGCSNLKNIVLEDGVTAIAPYAFYNCSKLENISIPDTITRFENWCFGFCQKLKTVYIPDGCTFLDSAVFYYCLVINNIQVPDTVTIIGSHCFRACMALSNLTISNNVKSIQYRAFNGCAFSELKIPESVTSIGGESFYQCSKLEKIEIPKAVTSIGNAAFYGCTKLNEVIVYGKDTVLNKIFTSGTSTSVGKNIVVYVIADSTAEQTAKENELAYTAINQGPNVVASDCLVNGTVNESNTKTILSAGDTVSVNYKIINASENKQDLYFMICLYDENGQFLTRSYIADDVEANKSKEIGTDITAEESCYARVILMDNLSNLVPLSGAEEI